jgi:putative oxidoreductase
MSAHVFDRHPASNAHPSDSGLRELDRYLVPLGRALFSILFIMSVPGHFSAKAIAAAGQHGLPFASVLVPLSGVVALLGGLSILLGYKARAGAFLLVLFLVPVTWVMHAYWNVSDPGMAQMQEVQFLKNHALIGAALLIAYFGAGPVSLDARRDRDGGRDAREVPDAGPRRDRRSGATGLKPARAGRIP